MCIRDRFTASVNLGSSRFFRESLNEFNTNQFLTNTFNSSVSYSKRFVGTPFNLSVAATHTQNTNNQSINMTFPSVNLTISKIFPFEGKGGVKKNPLQKMGFDYAMRYAPKKEYKAKDENADYVPFLEITGQLKGASTISASKSYEKYAKKGKPNVGDDICWPLFKKYDEKLASLGSETFVEFCQKTLEGIGETVDMLSQKISAMKFYLMITNSWFEGVDKSDEFEYDGMVVKVKEVNEYL